MLKKKYLSKNVATMLTEESYELLIAITKKTGFSQSEFVRMVLEERMKQLIEEEGILND